MNTLDLKEIKYPDIGTDGKATSKALHEDPGPMESVCFHWAFLMYIYILFVMYQAVNSASESSPSPLPRFAGTIPNH